ncbi:hypothetical protein QEG73_08880 [Chitinophagaceae bacterium 26-R-25]|nr:hypothetical protein [Chitinophagaceae bacterium 26-R-25]
MIEENNTAEIHGNTFKCENCGAAMHFAPGTHSLKCDFCETVNEIPDAHQPVRAYDYNTFINDHAKADTNVITVTKCNSCGAVTTMDDKTVAGNCTFCGSPLLTINQQQQEVVKPHYVLPFFVNDQQAKKNFGAWMKKLWFAPSDLQRVVEQRTAGALRGIYIPYWVYDTDTETEYTGRRGEYYYTTETYTETVDGKSETRTRQVRHTAWYPASGEVDCPFSDLLISASTSLPQKIANKLEPWELSQLVAYDERYLSGFRAELYQVNAQRGFDIAKQKMVGTVEEEIRRDIGGDEQQISNYDTQYYNTMLKYVLLPVWMCAYNYKNKLYHFTVNACTGEVVGERPYSALKIVMLVLAVIALGIAIYVMSQRH